MNIRSVLTPLALLLSATGAPAVELQPLVVTATRTAETVDDTLTSVTVITREEIQRRQLHSIHEVVRGVAGVSFSNNGGAGKQTELYLRGTKNGHLLVLVDGIKMGSATTGATALQDIPLALVERIEIVRGPRSSLYGSEAVGGVIQIFTRKGGGEMKPFLSATIGSDNWREGTLGLSGGGERGWFNASLTSRDTDGFNSCDGGDFSNGCGIVEPDEDGHRNLSGSLRAGYRFGNGLELDAHLLQSEGETDFDGSFTNHTETIQQVVGASVRYTPNENWSLKLSGGQNRDKSDNFKDGLFMSKFNTRRTTISLQNDIYVADDHLLTWGLDYLKDEVVSTTDYTEKSRNNHALFIEYQGSHGRHDWQLSLREDDNQQFGEYGSGSAAWGYALTDRVRFRLAYGTAFKAPSFNDLYFPAFGMFPSSSNLDLVPEESSSLEAGLDGDMGWGRWSMSVYRTRIDDMIAYDATTFKMQNIDAASITGFETSLSTRLWGWDLEASLTLLEHQNRSSGANRGNRLPRRAGEVLRVAVDRRFGDYSIGATLNAEGSRYNDVANNVKLDGFETLDLRAEYRFSHDWRLQARIENLFDEDYQTAAFFNQPGRTLFLTLSYQP
ncbi:MAG: TonB-dependent vitamin B12 receptor [Gammaproteobacteria bacterium]|nr:TonB-dependent vitamin B12 receptor [Gammaproteobacteria bacterium]